jgi:enoyl-CoA hydratase/carnithine racemase
MHQIRMAQPGKNALSTGLMAFLEAELHKADGEPILLTGEGDAFSAGVDLREIAAADAAAIERFLRRLDALVARINLYPAPVVALVNGHAIAGGCILALACDWRVAPAGTKAKIGLNELALGACIPPACLRVVRQRLGQRGAERAIFGASLLGVDEAARAGFLDEVVEGDAMHAALAKLQALSALPRAAYGTMKHALRTESSRTSAYDEERLLGREVPIWSSSDMRQRIEALLGKAR